MTAAPFTPNPFADREPWTLIAFGGTFLNNVALTKINGVSTKHEWKEQKSKETSGSTNTFSGTKYGHPKLTFTAATIDDFDELYSLLWSLLAPVPGLGGTGSTGTPAPVITTPQTSTAGGTPIAPPDTPTPAASSSSTPNPGPRPPTISVQYPSLARHGIFAVALEEWEDTGFTEGLGYEVVVTLIPDKPPVPAGAGAMAPPAAGSTGSQFQAGAGGSTDPVQANAAAGAGGV